MPFQLEILTQNSGVDKVARGLILTNQKEKRIESKREREREREREEGREREKGLERRYNSVQ